MQTTAASTSSARTTREDESQKSRHRKRSLLFYTPSPAMSESIKSGVYNHTKCRYIPEIRITMQYSAAYSLTFPSTVNVTTCHGINFPLFFSAFIAACSSPPQQGTSILRTVMLLISFDEIICVSLSV